jgi:hypothetical protein
MTNLLMIFALVFVTPTQNHDYKVFVTKDRYQADLWVWKTESRYQATNIEQNWFETKSRYEADFTVKFVDSRYKADLIIFYTKNKNEAGWKRKHKLCGLLGDEFGC